MPRDLIDPEDGENRAVRAFLMHYDENRAVRAFLMHYGAAGLTIERQRENMKLAGWDGCWPEWVNTERGHLTKGGAQHWLRHLFALESAPDGAAR